MAKLQAFKPLGDAERTGIVFDALYDDLQQFPEVAVVLALDDLRLSEGKFFPTAGEIINEVKVYDSLIKDVIDYLEVN